MKKLGRPQKLIFLTAGVLLVAAVVLGVLVARPNHTTAVVTPQPRGPQTDTTDQQSGSGQTASPSPSPGSGSSASGSPAAPASIPAPTGSLLSSSKASLTSTEESTCTTQHGTACYLIIKNSSGAEVARLAIPEVDGNGGHLVDWTVNKYISAAGMYTVSALAVSGTATASSNSYDLEVTN